MISFNGFLSVTCNLNLDLDKKHFVKNHHNYVRHGLGRTQKRNSKNEITRGVPVVAQWLTNPTRNHEVSGSVPALAQWVKVPALP